MSEYVVAQAAVLIVPSLDGFQRELKAQLKAIQADLARNALEVEVKAKGIPKMLSEIELAKQAAEESPIELRVDTVNVMKRLTEIRHEYEDLSRDFRKALVLDLKIVGISLLPQLAAGLAAVNSDMVRLVQSSLVLPGILSGVASSIAAVVAGIGGVGEAFKEYSDAQKNAAQEGLKARNSAKNVQNAYRDLGRSFKDARRNLEDLNAQLRDAPLDEADAIIRVTEARAEAADRAGKSGLQQQKDTLALIQAENSLADTRLRNSRLVQDAAEANAKGVAGADAVRDATDRLAKAEDEAATQTTKLSDSLSKLSPNAQKFVQSVTGMESQWTSFRMSIQDRLFAGLDQEVQNLATNSLPLLTRGLGGIADALNNNVATAFGVFQKAENQNLLEKIFGNTADAQQRFDNAIEPLLDGFLKISEAGSTFLPRLADSFAQVMQRFENFVTAADNDGSLDRWINDGLDALTQLGNSIINLGSILTSVSDAFTGSGGKTMLEMLENATERLAEFLKTDEGQQKLIDFFKEAREQLREWKPLLSELPGMLSSLGEAGKEVASIILPWLTTAAKFLADHPGLVKAAITAYLGFRTVGPIVKGIINLFDKELFTILRQIPANSKVAFDSMGKGLKGTVGGMKSVVKDLASAIGGPGGILMTAVTGLTLYLANEYMKVQQEAAEAAQSHADALKNVGNQIDSVSGKLTREGFLDKLKELADYENVNLPGNPNFNLFNEGKKVDISQQELGNAVSGDAVAREEVLNKVKREIAAALGDPNSQYNATELKNNLESQGFTFSDLVDALAGDAMQAERYKQLGTGVTLTDLLQGYRLGPFEGGPGLGDRALAAANIGKKINEDARATEQATAAQRDINAAGGGVPVTLNPNNPFTQLGNPEAFTVPGGGGSVAVTVALSPEQIERQFPDLWKKFKDTAEIKIIPLANGTQIELSPEQARQYAVPGMAVGGLLSGPGSGTSDSMLIRASHGEYVVNADATKKNLPLLESINGGKEIPGFSAGGPIKLDPVIDDSGVLQGDTKYSPNGLMPDDATANALLQGGLADAILGGGLMGANDPAAIQSGLPVPFTSDLPAVPAIPGPKSEPITGGTTSTSTDPRVNPTTTVHGGVSVQPGAGGQKSTPGFPTGAGFPSPGGYINQGTGAISAQVPGGVSASGVPARISTDFLESYGLPVMTDIKYGQAGFPDWVYQIGNEFGMQASTYPEHQSGSGYNRGIDWAPVGASWDTPEGAAKMEAYARHLASTGMVEQLIYHNPFTGAKIGVYNGKLVGPGTDQPDFYAGDWYTHRNHIHTRTSKQIPNLTQLQAMQGLVPSGSSPSNMPMANTPAGVQLPQLTYGPAGAAGSGIPGLSGAAGGIRMPTPEEYVKYVTESWMETLDNLVKNAGQIALGFLGSFVGLDFSRITGLANSVMGGIDLPGMNDEKDGEGADLPANPTVEWLLANLDKLPPEYQQAVMQVMQNSPGQSGMPMLEGLAQQLGSGAQIPVFDQTKMTNQKQSRGGVKPDMFLIHTSEGMDGQPLVDWMRQMNDRSYNYVIDLDGNAVRKLVDPSEAAWSVGGMNNRSINAVIGGTKASWSREEWLSNAGNAIKTLAAVTVNDAKKFGIPLNVLKPGMNEPGVGGHEVATALGFTDHTDPGPNFPWDVFAGYLSQINGASPAAAATGSGSAPQMKVDPATGKSYWPAPGQYASGGMIKGMGSGTSDSMIARVSNGEYIIRADAARKHMGLLDAINGGKMPGFRDGGPIINPMFPPPPVPPVSTPPPPPAPVPPDPGGPAADTAAGIPAAPTPVTENAAPGDAESSTLKDVGAAIGGIGDVVSGVADGASAPAGGNPEGDPRAVMGAAPQNLDHNKPAVSAGIQAAGSAISGAISTAMSVGSAGASLAAPGAGAGLSSASGIISGLIGAGSGAVSGAVNILSSLGVGTVTPSTSTAGAYGAPLLPQTSGQDSYKGPSVVNNWNGGVHTQNNEEFYKLQQRRELQNAAPYLPQR